MAPERQTGGLACRPFLPRATRNSPGTLTIEGDLLAANGALVLELGNAQSFHRLVVSGNADIGRIRFVLPEGFKPGAGDSFAVLAVGDTLSGFAAAGDWWIEAPDPYGNGCYIWANANGVYGLAEPGQRLSFANGTLSVTAVPEPQPSALLLCGLLRVGVPRRRAARP